MKRKEAERKLEELPRWAPGYLAMWGSTKDDGGRMTVTYAAESVGATAEAVRQLRHRSPAFRRLEEIARHSTDKWAQSYVKAGLRVMAPSLMEAVHDLIQSRNPQVVLKILDWLRDQPQQVELSWRDMARREGLDPDEIERELVGQFVSAMVGAGQEGGVSEGDADPPGTEDAA